MEQKGRLFRTVLLYNLTIGVGVGLLRRLHSAAFYSYPAAPGSTPLSATFDPVVLTTFLLMLLLAAVIVSILAQRRLKPLFAYLGGTGSYPAARRALAAVPWLISALHPLLQLLGTGFLYAVVYQWEAPDGAGYASAMLLAFAGGVVSGLYAALATNRALLEARRRLGSFGVDEGGRDRFLELQERLILVTAIPTTAIFTIYAFGSGADAPAIAGVVVVLSLLFVHMSALARASRRAQLSELLGTLGAFSDNGGDLRNRARVLHLEEFGQASAAVNRLLELVARLFGRMQRSVERLTGVGGELAGLTEAIDEGISSVAATLEGIRGELGRQNQAAEESAAAVREVAEGIGSLDSLVEGEIEVVHDSSAAIEEGLANVRSLGRNVGTMGEAFRSLVEQAGDGKAKISMVTGQIEQLRERSQALEEANRLISTIAARTNLLAMNAAIEAAHAGEAGRGFAVVAEEIRHLAENAAEQSVAIRDELRATESVIAEVTGASEAADASFQGVLDRVGEVDQLQSELVNAVEEQNQGNEQIFEAISRITETTGNLRNSTTELRRYTETAGERMESLNKLSAAAAGEIAAVEEGISDMLRRVAEARRQSAENRRVAEELSAVSNRFRLVSGEDEELLGEVDLDEGFRRRPGAAGATDATGASGEAPPPRRG